MKKRDSDTPWWLYALLLGGLLLLSMRFLVALRFLLIPLLAIAAVATLGYLVWKYFHNKRQEKAFRESVEGIIATNQEHCQQQIAYYTAQMEDIEASIRELEDKLNPGPALSAHIIAETQQLISSFQAEWKLQASKRAFFETCSRKLEQLLQQHHLRQELDAKKEKLKSMQERNYDDLASMEELRTNVEMEALQLDTIENLSQRILQSSSYNDAERLRAELNEMTRSLDEL
ncbi:MAG TPA: hypothetical protein PKC76_06270 [Saprospiraceae bacterium]|nr:hypothetical protein [Saprospiraceae bacterium]HMP23716.1 hypothetical protein [Saprospiraceae bacterium]